jgi:hypothetical protein
MQRRSKDSCIFYRLTRPLSKSRHHRMSRISHQRHLASSPLGKGLAGVDIMLQHVAFFSRIDQGFNWLMPTTTQHL